MNIYLVIRTLWCEINTTAHFGFGLTPQKSAKASVEAPPDIFPATNGPIPFGFRPKTGVFACALTPLILWPVNGDKINFSLI